MEAADDLALLERNPRSRALDDPATNRANKASIAAHRMLDDTGFKKIAANVFRCALFTLAKYDVEKEIASKKC